MAQGIRRPHEAVDFAAIERLYPPPPEYYEAPPEETRPARRRESRRTPAMRSEWELVRVMLHRPAYLEFIAERVGPQDLHDPALRAIYPRLAALPPERGVDEIAAGLDDDAAAILQVLLAEDEGLDTVERTVNDCLAALAGRGVEIRVLPSLWNLHDAVVQSSVSYSIIRMRNASPRSAK